MQINKDNHIFLLVEKKYSDIEEAISNIFCSFLQEDLEQAKKIKNRTYYDFIDIDSTDENIKDKISEIKNKFENKSIEYSGYKFYVIRNVEKLSKISINSLLKFIEEPQRNTIGILTTRNVNMVIDTIKSRCEEISLKSSNDIFENFITNNNIEKYKDFFYNGFFNISDIKKYSEYEIKEIMEISNYFQSDFEYNNILLEVLKKFKKLDYEKISIIIDSIKDKFSEKKYYSLLKVIESLRLNPNKTLVFYSIIKTIKED